MSTAASQLHIQRLVLQGFSPLDAQRVRDAFAQALAEPASDALAPATGQGRLHLAIARPASPEALGRAAAQALRQALQADPPAGPPAVPRDAPR
ncbi:MAG: hypothetical protein KBC73_09010 [Burkholderiaceae bacterium]|nr:hypothetical protein [Burkholderiaceae bacterium]